MRVPVLELPIVYHIGTLDPAMRGQHHHRTSQEGAGLSVSLCPDGWRRIAKLGGYPLQKLDREGALFLDLDSMDAELRAAVGDWAVTQGLAARETRWLAWTWDDEEEGWRGMTCLTREDAVAELEAVLDGDEPTDERLALPDEEGGPPGGSLVSCEEALVLTGAGDARALGFGRDTNASDIAAMFYAEDVLRPAMPDLLGVWWGSDYEPLGYRAPKGAILPSCVGAFSARETGWDGVPDDEELLAELPDTRKVEVELAEAPPGPR